MKLLDILNEITIQSSRFSDDKYGFVRYVKMYFNIIKSLQPEIKEKYDSGNKLGLAQLIIKKLSILPNEQFIDWFNFRDWLQGIDQDDLPYYSSGSFATAIEDTDFIYNIGMDNYGMTEEECEDLVLNL